MADTCIEFDFLEGFPNQTDVEEPHDAGWPVYQNGYALCPYDNKKLVTIGSKNGNVLTEAGLLCKGCGYEFDLFTGKEYRVL